MERQEIKADTICPLHGEGAPPQLRNILVIVDPTASTHPCIDKAARIAQACGSALALYICDAERASRAGPRDAAKQRELREVRREDFLSDLERLAAPLRARGIAVTVHSEWRAPLEQGIGRHVIRSRPDLVVKDTHRHPRPPTRVVNALTDRKLMRLIAPPLLLVGPEPWADRVHITVGADPCRPAERPVSLDQSMLAMGDLLGSALRGRLDVLHVLRSPPHLPGEPVSPDDTNRAHSAARGAVERLVEGRTDRGAPLPIHFVEGRVAPSILDFTRRHRPQLLVIGAAARPRWAHGAASGTAAQLLESLEPDLLVVKAPGFQSPLLVTDD
jgi:universal stress protein E